MAVVFEPLRREEQALGAELRQAEPDADPQVDIETEVGAALGALDRMADLATDQTNFRAIGELFRRLHARLFLTSRGARLKRRTMNRVAGGVVTFGAIPPPVPHYEGPTGRRG